MEQRETEVTTPQEVHGAVLDSFTIDQLTNAGITPILTFWSFHQQYGIGWDFAEHSKNHGE